MIKKEIFTILGIIPKIAIAKKKRKSVLRNKEYVVTSHVWNKNTHLKKFLC